MIFIYMDKELFDKAFDEYAEGPAEECQAHAVVSQDSLSTPDLVDEMEDILRQVIPGIVVERHDQ